MLLTSLYFTSLSFPFLNFPPTFAFLRLWP